MTGRNVRVPMDAVSVIPMAGRETEMDSVKGDGSGEEGSRKAVDGGRDKAAEVSKGNSGTRI